MHPIAYELHLFGTTRPIGGYGVFVALGVLATGLLVGRAAWRAREDVGGVIATIGYTAMAAFLGAGSFFLFVEWARGVDPWVSLQRGGGLVFYGAVPPSILVSFLAARALRVDWWKMVDLSIPAIAVGHALGRVGCFLGGCCYGVEWHGAWAATFTDPMAPAAHPSVPRHPVQLYESFGLLLLALAFASIPLDARWVGKPGSGARASAYLVAYGALRIGVEALRGDGVRGLFLGGLLSTSQIVSLVGIALGLVGLVRARHASRSRTPALA